MEHAMQFSLIRTTLVIAAVPFLSLSSCKRETSKSQTTSAAPASDKEKHTKGHKKQEKKAEKEKGGGKSAGKKGSKATPKPAK